MILQIFVIYLGIMYKKIFQKSKSFIQAKCWYTLFWSAPAPLQLTSGNGDLSPSQDTAGQSSSSLQLPHTPLFLPRYHHLLHHHCRTPLLEDRTTGSGLLQLIFLLQGLWGSQIQLCRRGIWGFLWCYLGSVSRWDNTVYVHSELDKFMVKQWGGSVHDNRKHILQPPLVPAGLQLPSPLELAGLQLPSPCLAPEQFCLQTKIPWTLLYRPPPSSFSWDKCMQSTATMRNPKSIKLLRLNFLSLFLSFSSFSQWTTAGPVLLWHHFITLPL